MFFRSNIFIKEEIFISTNFKLMSFIICAENSLFEKVYLLLNKYVKCFFYMYVSVFFGVKEKI